MAKKKPRRSVRPPTKKQRAGAQRPLYNNPSKRLDLAVALERQGKETQSLSQFDEAMRREPDNIRAYVLAARANAAVYRLDRVDEIFSQLIRRSTNHPGVYHCIGELYAQIKLPQKSVAAYEHAATLPGVLPDTWMELASVYERAHRLDEAWELIEKAKAKDLELPMMSIVEARLLRRMKQPENAEAALQDFIKSQPTKNTWTCQAWGEISIIRDRCEDFDGAMEAILQCKSLQQEYAAPFVKGAAETRQRLNEMVMKISRSDFEKWQRDCDEYPDAGVSLLTGFPRSGTTLLEQMLDAHPRLISSEERDYLGKSVFQSVLGKTRNRDTDLVNRINALPRGKIRYERDQYFRVMESFLGESVGECMLLDKNPAYNLTIPLLLRLFPEARLLIALRDPRDVVLSCFLRYLPLNSVSACFLTLESTAERYAFDMQAWLRLKEKIPGPWCEVRYEDTVADLESQVRRILPTLGLAWNDAVLAYRERLTGDKPVNSPTYEAVTQPIYTRAIGRWKNYEKYLGPVLESLQPFVDEFRYA